MSITCNNDGSMPKGYNVCTQTKEKAMAMPNDFNQSTIIRGNDTTKYTPRNLVRGTIFQFDKGSSYLFMKTDSVGGAGYLSLQTGELTTMGNAGTNADKIVHPLTSNDRVNLRPRDPERY